MSQQQPEETARLDEFVQRQVADAVRRRREREDADAALRAATLASDTDRDLTAQVLNEAFAEGRLTPEEHADRTTRALRRAHPRRPRPGPHRSPGAGGADAAPQGTARKVRLLGRHRSSPSPFLLMGSALTAGRQDARGPRLRHHPARALRARPLRAPPLGAGPRTGRRALVAPAPSRTKIRGCRPLALTSVVRVDYDFAHLDFRDDSEDAVARRRGWIGAVLRGFRDGRGPTTS